MNINFENIWNSKSFISICLLPLSWLFRAIVACRRKYYLTRNSNVLSGGYFTIVVGNISVGGTGKTPLVIWLAQHISSQQFRVGIVSRGYKRECKEKIIEVEAKSSARDVGDEALLIAQKTSCPVIVAVDRKKAAEQLVKKYNVNIVISDDGLQHYNLPRNFEIAVVDAARGFGNGRCLPAGPLREPVSRLKSCDLVVYNGGVDENQSNFRVCFDELISIGPDSVRRPLNKFQNLTVHAVAGIGSPDRFFKILKSARLNIIEHKFPDHHLYQANDLEFNDNYPVIMTEKDAVKCKHYVLKESWYLPITISVNRRLKNNINTLIEGISRG